MKCYLSDSELKYDEALKLLTGNKKINKNEIKIQIKKLKNTFLKAHNKITNIKQQLKWKLKI